MDAPVMGMGFLGFGDPQQLINLLCTRSRNVRWVSCALADADALWIKGSSAQMIRDGLVRIPSDEPSQRATVLNLKEVDRPIAFTTPLHPKAMFQPALTFDPSNAESVAAVLNVFEQELRQPTIELRLAHELARRRHDIRSPVMHLILHGVLVGVVVLSGRIGLAPTLVPSDFEEIEWSGRPSSADEISPQFVKTDLASVMWRYSGRTQDDLLPKRYKQGPIYFRRMPLVPQRLVRDIHLMLMSELRTMPQTYAQLRASTGMTDVQASQSLAALYFAGSITTDSRKALAVHQGSQEHRDSDLNTSIIGEELPSAAAVPARPGRRARVDGPSTVPTPLEPGRR